MADYSKTYAAKEAQARAHIAELVARFQQGDQSAAAELSAGARTRDGNIPGTSRGAVNLYRQSLKDLGDPTHEGGLLRQMKKTASPVKDIGGVVKKLAPLTVFIPGVGPVMAGAIGAAGGLAHGDSVGSALAGGVAAGLTGGALKAAKAALAARGAAGAAGAAAGSAGAAAGAPAAAAAGGGGIGGLLGAAGNYVKSHPTQIMGALGAINAAGQQAKGSDAVDQAAGIATGQYNQTAPLRQRAVQMLSQPMPQARDLSYLNDPANPYARRPPVAPVAPVAPLPPGGARPMTRY